MLREAEPAEILKRFAAVTPVVASDLKRYVALLRQWQGTHNLVARSTLDDVWTRHVADSLQLLDHAGAFHQWVDLGSGAGFPGLVIAIASKASPERRVTLVEANQKKAAFLRAAIRETTAKADVAAERIEAHAATMAGAADVVSARALAPLDRLMPLAFPYLDQSGVLLAPKGQDFVQELNAASKSWDFDVLDSPSATDPGGRILAIRQLSPRGPQP